MDIKTEIGEEAMRIVSGARRAAYGTPERNFARIAALWNAHLSNVGVIVGAEQRRVHPLDVAVMCLMIKAARIAETPDHRDSYVDMVGYALCAAECALEPVEQWEGAS